jgi:hypothetical protein
VKWLFLVHRVRTLNSRERVRVWRLIRKVGAELYRNSVYVLPYNRERLEDFQWACQQIRDSKGEASIYVCRAQDPKEDRILKNLFQKSRQEGYAHLLKAARKMLDRIERSKRANRFSIVLQSSFQKEYKQLREQLKEIERNDFFNSFPKELRRTLGSMQRHLATAQPEARKEFVQRRSIKAFQGKIWATRQNIHIDRIASAWLIRNFIDHKARFVFAPEDALPKNAIIFDVFGAEFSHHGEDCTFETLLKVFGLRDRGLKVIGEIIHDVDLKDNKYCRPEASGLDAVVRSLADTIQDDHKLLESGSEIFQALYGSYSSITKKTKKVR